MTRARHLLALGVVVLVAACGLATEGIEPEKVADAGVDGSTVTPRDGAPNDAADAGRDGDADASEADAGPLAKSALQFDGVDDFVRMPRPVSDDFTLEAWMPTTGSGPGPNFWDGPPVFQSDIPAPNSDFGSSIQLGKFAFGMGAPDKTVVGTIDVATGQWVHVAVTRAKNAGIVTLFVNGVQDGRRTDMSTASLDANPNLDIGANFGQAYFFKGLIDEVRAWNVARTPEQIRETMKTPLLGNEPGLVGYWRFDEDAGETVIDRSPTQANGSLGTGDAGAQPVRVPSSAF